MAMDEVNPGTSPSRARPATSATTTATVPQRRAAPEKAHNDRAIKRRSPRACLSCRTRKVRCDVIKGGSPCTNCRLDDVDCILTESSRGRKPSDGTHINARRTVSPSGLQPVAPQIQQATPPHNEPPTDYILSLTFENQQTRPQPVELGDETDSQDDQDDYDLQDGLPNHDQGPTAQDQRAQHECQPDMAILNTLSPPRSQRSQGSQPQNSNSSRNGVGRVTLPTDTFVYNPNAALPPYIKPLPTHIGPRDIEYLRDKDAITIPDDEFRDELLKTYIKIIHNFMPTIELEQILVPIIKGDGQNPVSLLLFQAVMFASVIFVSSETLRSRGFTSRKAARKTFFNRVRLLYGLDCEPDRLILIQALLLMTYWYDSPEDEKDTWYWMGVTLSLSQVLGLHRDPETLHVSLQEKRQRRRIWWSCYIRDRLLALGIRRPTRIRQEDFNVPMLELDDFEITQPNQDHIAFVKTYGFTMLEADRRRAMCQICIELTKLCVSIGDILHSQYSAVGFQAYSSEHYKNIAVLPRESDRQMAELVNCDAQLEEWHRGQKTACRYTSPPPFSTTTSGQINNEDWADKIIWLHQALLRMIYLTAIGALHRPRALGAATSEGASNSAENIAGRKASTRKVKDAAAAVTRLAFDLQSEGFLRYLSTSSIPAFLSAALIHLLDVRASDEEVRSLAIGRYYQCFYVLSELQDMYSSADYAVRFLESVLKRMTANIPMLSMLRFCAKTTTQADGHFTAAEVQDAPRVSPYENYNLPVTGQPARAPQVNSDNHFSAPVVTQTYRPNNVNGNNPINVISNGGIDISSNRQSSLNLDYLFEGTPLLNGDLSAQPGNNSHIQMYNDPFLDGTSHLDLWNGMDGLLPALIDFDADPLMGLAQNDMQTPARSWRP